MLAAGTLLLLVAAGCARLDEHAGPHFALSDVVPPLETPVLTVRTVDERPDWERQYCAVAERPDNWQRGIGFVPLENLQPDFGRQLQQVIEAEAARQEAVPLWAELKIHSFQLVVNEAAKLEAEFRRMQSRATAGTSIGTESGGLSLSLAVASDPGGPRRPYRDREDVPREIIRTSAIVDGRIMRIGPPSQLTGHYVSGVTCRLEATVTYFPEKGDPDVRPLECHVQVPVHTWASWHRDPSIRSAVQQVLRQASVRLTEAASPASE